MKTNLNNKIHEKRAELKELSQPLRMLMKEGEIANINEGLKDIYKNGGHNTLNTLNQWNKQGKQVKKGEKALLLWARPKHVERINEETTEVDDFDYWPICYVFSDAQVKDRRAE
jgi:hypothetical protein